MIDNNNIMKASGEVTATGDGTAVNYGAGDAHERTYMCNVTAVSGTNPTLDIAIKESSDDSTYKPFLSFPQITAIGQYYVTGRSNQPYRRETHTIGGTNTPKFTYSLQEVTGGRYDKY